MGHGETVEGVYRDKYRANLVGIGLISPARATPDCRRVTLDVGDRVARRRVSDLSRRIQLTKVGMLIPSWNDGLPIISKLYLDPLREKALLFALCTADLVAPHVREMTYMLKCSMGLIQISADGGGHDAMCAFDGVGLSRT